jgi:trimeric autotransporter adhesin
MKLGCATTIGTARLAMYALLVAAAACGGGGGGDITPPTPTVASVTLSPGSATIIAGQTASFTAQPKDAAGNAVNGIVVGWSISDPNVASVVTGTVTAARPGQATLTATAGNVSTTAAITVIPAVANVTVAPAASSLIVGGTVTLTPTLTDAGGSTITGRAVTWTSSNDAVASVSTAGVVTAKTIGTATITASVEGRSATASVNVKSATVTSVAVTSGTVRVGSRVQLRATGTLNDGTTQTLTGSAVNWSSSDQSKATVDADGNVTGVAVGTVTITATNPASNMSGSATVTVASATSPIITALSVAPASVDVRGGAQTVTVSGTVSDGSGTGISSVAVTASGHTLSTAHPDPTAGCTATGAGIGANGAWSCTFTLPRGAAAGPWPIVSAVVTDNASHVTTYSAGDIAAAFSAKVTVNSNEDLTAPLLKDITVAEDGMSPPQTNVLTVDVTSGPKKVNVTAHYVDDLSGTASFTFKATSVANPKASVSCTGTLQSGTPADGVWGCSVTFPQNADKDNWTEDFTGVDAALNADTNRPAVLIKIVRTP